MSTIEMKAPATGATWFNLHRHDGEEGDNPPEPPETSDGDDGDDDDAQQMLADALDDDTGDESDDADDREGKPDAAKGLGAAGKKALDRMKAERAAAKKTAAAEKKRADDLARQVEEFKDRDRTAAEKLEAKAERAQQQATKAVARAVTAEVKVLAVGKFADPSDAVDVLMRDPAKYVDSDGDIDVEAIDADLADLLERKPHWAKPEPVPAAAPEAQQKPKPKPDPGQGSRGGPAKVDFRTASDEEYAAELAKYGVRRRF